MFDSFKKKIARSLQYRLSKISPDYLGEEFECPFCETKLSHFLPLPIYYLKELNENQFIHSIFQSETLNIENYSCPACFASDRDRLYCLYLKSFLQTINKTEKLKLLEIAPSQQLRKFLQQISQINYRSADLFMPDVDDKVDITDMKNYHDGQFDIFICSHVLEHIEDDVQAMKELYRILSPQGWGIAMAPINLALDADYENSLITDEAGRWKHFGQNDHIRMYSKPGFINKLERVGFKVEQIGIDFFGKDTFKKYGIHPRSVIYIVKK